MASPASESKPSDLELPAPEASDSAEVTSCLEAAAELWKSGQTKEAIRSIQRGAEAAEQDGNDMRALKLARLGADLSAQVVASAAPAVPAAPSAASDSNGVAVSSASAPSAPSASRPHPANHPSVRVSQPPPLPGAAATQPTPSPPSVGPSPAAKADKADKADKTAKDEDRGEDKDKDRDEDKDRNKDEVAAAPGVAPPASASSPSDGPASVRSAPAPSRSRAPSPAAERASVKPSAPRGGALGASAPPKPSAPPTPAASTSSSVAELLASGLAERVSVKRSSLDASLLVVRPISRNGAKPARGTRQAVLIYVDGDPEA